MEEENYFTIFEQEQRIDLAKKSKKTESSVSAVLKQKTKAKKSLSLSWVDCVY